MTKIFDTSTVKGIGQAERFKAKMENQFESVNVYAIGLSRVQIVALRPIADNRGQAPEFVPVAAQRNL
jgi:hypothetical protein